MYTAVPPDRLLIDSQICVTLNEWEHIAERFEKATHYLEKALYKMLTQNIVPIVTAELRVGPLFAFMTHY